MSMQPLRDIVNDTAATAVNVEWNFNTIESFINTGTIHRDGLNSMQAPLTLFGTPSAALHAATKQYVDSIIPTGSIVDYAGGTAPTGWLLCNGGIKDQAEYPALYSVLGSTYNTGGEGGSQFRLPDFTNRVAVGVGTNVLGVRGGQANVAVAAHVHPVGSHTHTLGTHQHTISGSITAVGNHNHTMNHDHAATTTSGDTHDHAMPYAWVGAYGTGTLGLQLGGVGAAMNLSTSSVNSDAHVHSVDLPTFAGSTGADGGHTHNHTLLGSASNPGNTTSTLAADTGSTGVTSTNENYPPFIAVNKIIKAT